MDNFKRRDTAIAWIINHLILPLASIHYRQSISGAIEYGMRAAARDQQQGNPPPPDWRTTGDTE